MPTLEFLPMLGLIAVLWLGGRRVISGDLSLGSFVAFNAYIAMLVWPLRVLGQRVTTLQKAVGASARISEVLDAEPQLRDPRHPEPLERPVRGDVRLSGVQFGHEGGHPVLDGLDLHVAPGESVALVGATGSGKSTVAGLLARLYDPDAGSVSLDGHDVRQLRIADVRGAVALVFEETFLFTDTVRENIRFARPDAGDEDVERAAELAGAAGFIADLPDGYGTLLGERGFSLSGGQRQRVAIARAILADPAVLVLDDATSAVDATKEHEIRAALTTVMSGRTTLVIAHRPATIALADRVAVLEGGRIVEQGTHAELLRSIAALPGSARPGGRRMMERASAKAVWRHTRGLLRPVRKLYLGAGAAVMLSTLITLAGPALVRYAVDAGIRKARCASAECGGAALPRAGGVEAVRRARADPVRGEGRASGSSTACASLPSTSCRRCRSGSSSASGRACSCRGSRPTCSR